MINSPLARIAAVVLTNALVLFGCARHPVDQNTLDRQLLKAARNGDATQVRILLRRGAQIGATDESGDTALDAAVMQGDSKVASALLEQKVDVKGLNRALFWAAINEPLVVAATSTAPIPYHGPKIEPADEIDDWYTNVTRLLLDKGAEIEARDQVGATPLIRAAGHGETGVVKLLLERGARLEDRNSYGLTALNAAACGCPDADNPATLDVMKLLREKGADLESRDNDGNTPLIHAAGWGQTENVAYLSQAGVNLEVKNKDGNTALSIAAEGSALPSLDTVSYLVEHGSKIESRNNEGRTPLMLAVAGDGYEQIKVVKLLLERGADVRARDRHGDTPLSLALKHRKDETIPGTNANVRKLLRSALAKPN